MTTSGPRYHIPFPTKFLSLNTKPAQKKATGTVVPAPEVEVAQHGFLSNRTMVARNSSISSVSSSGSVSSAPTSPPTQVVESPTLKASVPTFLALNSKHVAPPTSAAPAGDKTTFLSNRH